MVKKGYIKYQCHLIGDFGFFEATNENIGKLMNEFPEYGFVPNVFIQQQLGSNIQNKRLSLQSTDRDLLIEIPMDRVIISCFNKFDNLGNIVQKDLVDVLDGFIKVLNSIMKHLNKEFYRMSFITEYYNESSDADDFKKFILPSEFYNQDEIFEWSFRLNRRYKIRLDGSLEKLNVISKFSKEINKKLNDSFTLNGVLYQVDVNTAHENQLERFNASCVKEFLNKALEINLKVSDEYGIL